jgi:hypothetical protein
MLGHPIDVGTKRPDVVKLFATDHVQEEVGRLLKARHLQANMVGPSQAGLPAAARGDCVGHSSLVPFCWM